MATAETKRTTKTAKKKPLYLEPRFTSERWSDGILNMETMEVHNALYIKEDALLSFSEREERETRKILFEYQYAYAEREYELLQKEFKAIEEKLKERGHTAGPDEFAFKEPAAPSGKKSRKMADKGKTSTKSSSGSETGDTSQEKITTPRKSKRIGSKSSK